MTKKEIASTFLDLASSGRVREAYEKYIHPDFRHHNPYFPCDRESLLVAMEESTAQFSAKVYKVVQVLEDGDRVVVHGRVRLKPGLQEIALMHIFRFSGDHIIEEWEVSQEVPKESPNKLGMF